MNPECTAAAAPAQSHDKCHEASAFLFVSIAQILAHKTITLTDEEAGIAMQTALERLTSVEIDCLARGEPSAEARAVALGYAAVSWAYAKKLCAMLPPLAQAEQLSWIAMEDHLYLADMADAPWPNLDAATVARFIDRDIGPVSHVFDDGIITSTYHRGIRLHRPEAQGPALTAITRAGLVVDEEYWRLGVQHRADGPAKIKFDKEDRHTEETWMMFGRSTRSGAPSYIHRTADGRVIFEMWFHNGILHRDDGPAYIENSRWGDDVYEKYSVNGIEGPLLLNGVQVGE